MGTPWIDSVRARGRLSFSLVREDTWGGHLASFNRAVSDFNSISKRRRLCVTLESSSAGPTQQGGADIVVELAQGPTISTTQLGTPVTGTFDGRGLHGKTFNFERDGKVEKASVFLPNQPHINTPQGTRLAGSGVITVIAFHELIHACGLSNADHNNTDVFNGFPSTFPGDSPDQDRLEIQVEGRRVRFPPIHLSDETVTRIRNLWCPPKHVIIRLRSRESAQATT